jgi:branched-chain amino acid transport system substrate-binding protein
VTRRLRAVIAALAIALVLAIAGTPASASTDVRIGVLNDCGGAFNEVTIAGAELPLIERGARLAGKSPSSGLRGAAIEGHPVRLFFACGDGTATSAIVEARRLIEEDGVDLLIGPMAGDEEIAVQDYARRHPETTFINGSGSARLTDPAPNFYSFHTDGATWMAGLGSYAYHHLGWRSAVTVADTSDVFNWAQAAGFTAEFCALGGKIVKRVSIPAGTSDYSAAMASIPRSGVDGFMIASTTDVALGLGKVFPDVRRHAGKRMVLGTIAMLDLRVGHLGKGAAGLTTGGIFYGDFGSYITRFKRVFPGIAGGIAGSPFDLFYYGAMKAALESLDATHGDVSNRHALQLALERVTLDAPNGRFRTNSRHQAAGSNLVLAFQWPSQVLEVIRKIGHVEPTFGGYFKPSDPPPSRTTPACVKRTPPRWARR